MQWPEHVGRSDSIRKATNWFKSLKRTRKNDVRSFIRYTTIPKHWPGTTIEFAYYFSSIYSRLERNGQMPLFPGAKFD